MIKKQATLSFFFSLLLFSFLASATAAETQPSKSASRPVRIAKSTLALMGYTGLSLCGGTAFYLCAVMSTHTRGALTTLLFAGLVSGGYSVWGGARGMLSSIKEIAQACHEKSGHQAQKNARAPKACCSGHGTTH